MKKLYFYNRKIVSAELPIQGYRLGEHFNNKDIHVPLSQEQSKFLEANPKAKAYEVWNNAITPIPEPIELTNEDIKRLRAQEYVMRSDKLYITWKRYEEQGEIDKATQLKFDWLQEIDNINLEYPYIK